MMMMMTRYSCRAGQGRGCGGNRKRIQFSSMGSCIHQSFTSNEFGFCCGVWIVCFETQVSLALTFAASFQLFEWNVSLGRVQYGRPGQHKLVGGMRMKIAFASKFKKKERKCVPAGYRTRALSRFLTSKCRKFCEANVITTTPRKRVSSRGHEGHPFLLLRSTHSTDALWMPFTH